MCRIKVCGVTCVDDARMAATAGVDAIGMVCHADAPRCITPATARAIRQALPPFVTPVLLFVAAPATEVARHEPWDDGAVLQFHGDEDAAFCTSFGRPYLKACRPTQANDIEAAMAAHPAATGVLADGGGGTGTAFDWDLIPPPARRPLPLVLAGGLQPGNVAAAVKHARPHAVDVSSGVCVAGDPLRKDPTLVRQFVAAVREAQAG